MRSISKIDTIHDAIKLSEAVFSIVPHSGNVSDLNISNIMWNYKRFKERTLCGWCYSNALFLHLLLREYGRDSYVYNHGFSQEQITHTVVIVTFGDYRYLLDPYFCRFYVDAKGNLLTFAELIDAIKGGCHSVKSIYGQCVKPVMQGGVFKDFTPIVFEKAVLGGWESQLNYKEFMQNKFNSFDPLYLIPEKIQKVRVICKSNGENYLEFF